MTFSCPQTTEKWAMKYDLELRHLMNHFSLFINGNKYQSQKEKCVIWCTLHVYDLATQSTVMNFHASPASYPVVLIFFGGKVSLWYE